jgi:hypothetical protein
MNQKTNQLAKSVINLGLCLILISFVSLGCAGVRKPWREYTQKPFNSEEWLAGDRIERGRMFADAFKKRICNGKSKEEITKLFGEPDKKTDVEGKEVWLYHVDLGFAGSDLNMFPISFDDKRGAYAGRVKGGTMSMLAEDE